VFPTSACTNFGQLTWPAHKRSFSLTDKSFLPSRLFRGDSFHSAAIRKEDRMFTRVVEIETKAGKGRDLGSAINEKVLPILKRQPGFVDEIMLVGSTEPDRILALSFWQTEADAERYNREQYSTVSEILKPLYERAPKVTTYNVHTSTTHKIAAGKAA
jgi:heme-degrading monooxygenase HmoA